MGSRPQGRHIRSTLSQGSKCSQSATRVSARASSLACYVAEKENLRRHHPACTGLRILPDTEVDELVASLEAEKAAAEAARRGPSSMTS